jgi:hypothetical protein
MLSIANAHKTPAYAAVNAISPGRTGGSNFLADDRYANWLRSKAVSIRDFYTFAPDLFNP